MEAEQEYDWWDDLSDEAKASIEQGLKDAEEGKLTPHEVMKNILKEYLQ
jgi:predicted transcriptional regulator